MCESSSSEPCRITCFAISGSQSGEFLFGFEAAHLLNGDPHLCSASTFVEAKSPWSGGAPTLVTGQRTSYTWACQLQTLSFARLSSPERHVDYGA